MSVSAIIYLLLIGLVVPILALLGKRALDRGVIVARIPFYIESALVQMVLFVIAALVAHRNRIDLRPALSLSPEDAFLGMGVLLLAIASMRLAWPGAGLETRQRLSHIVPHTTKERVYWIFLSAAAGIGEETAYRGALFAIIRALTGRWFVSALIASMIFGLAHLVQGWKNSAYVSLFGFVFHLLAAATGALYVGMAVHFLYDVVAGFWIARLLKPSQATDLIHA